MLHLLKFLFVTLFTTVGRSELVPLLPRRLNSKSRSDDSNWKLSTMDDSDPNRHFYASLEMGTSQSQTVFFMLDTTSSHNYVSCDQHDSDAALFNFYTNQSDSFEWLTCLDEQYCDVCVDTGEKCGYASGSTVYAMGRDRIGRHSQMSSQSRSQSQMVDFTFGCRYDAALGKLVTSNEAILALNRDDTSFIQQMVSQTKGGGNRNMFAHYLSDHYQSYLAVGSETDDLFRLLSINKRDMEWIPFATSWIDEHDELSFDPSLYQLEISTISIDDTTQPMAGNESHLLTIDTASNGIALSPDYQETFLSRLESNTGFSFKMDYSSLYPFCIDAELNGFSSADIYRMFPEITFEFDTIQFNIASNNYLISTNVESVNGSNTVEYCLEITFDWSDGILLGADALLDKLIVYDIDDSVFGFATIGSPGIMEKDGLAFMDDLNTLSPLNGNEISPLNGNYAAQKSGHSIGFQRIFVGHNFFKFNQWTLKAKLIWIAVFLSGGGCVILSLLCAMQRCVRGHSDHHRKLSSIELSDLKFVKTSGAYCIDIYHDANGTLPWQSTDDAKPGAEAGGNVTAPIAVSTIGDSQPIITMRKKEDWYDNNYSVKLHQMKLAAFNLGHEFEVSSLSMTESSSLNEESSNDTVITHPIHPIPPQPQQQQQQMPHEHEHVQQEQEQEQVMEPPSVVMPSSNVSVFEERSVSLGSSRSDGI